MKIGVISDTHIPYNCDAIPEELLRALKGCDLIIHAGDVLEISVINELEKLAKVEAVYGNMDPHKLEGILEQKKILDVSGKKICVIHGRGRPDNLINILKDEFFKEKPDIIIFGHSHVPMNEYIDGVLFFNPGSPTDKVYAPYRSYGIIEINEGSVKAEICKL